ncbi:MAG: alpha/beta hydrolase [DPANN group archaeon]|nr:alpha/beta hydrolase [DPANN group archaeon]
MAEKRIVFKNSAGQKLVGILNMPKPGSPIVVFGHGLHSGKNSPRNTMIAGELNKKGISTFLIDLRGHGESEGNVEESTLEDLGNDLASAVKALEDEDVDLTRLGGSGSSTGGVVCLLSKVKFKTCVFRATPWQDYYQLAKGVKFPCLFIIGGDDQIILDMTNEFLNNFKAPHEVHIIPNAEHLFEGHETEMLDKTVKWFTKHLLSNDNIK